MRNSTTRLNKNLHAVIMAGGKGTRFWPLSRETFPKQFLKLQGERTLIQDTIWRLKGAVRKQNVLVVTTEVQRSIVEWQVREMLGTINYVVEPEGKNTAPAIALAAYKLYKKNRDALLLVLPSDHFIGEPESFRAAVLAAVPAAEKGNIVTFGIKPSRPETGYGYIKSGRKRAGGVRLVERFVEKPSMNRARQYLKDGSYYWNSGMFLFRAADMIEEFKIHMPALHDAFMGIRSKLNTNGEGPALQSIYRNLHEESIDYGIMEKSGRVVMAEAGFPWSDIGSWDALADIMDTDEEGNISLGNIVELECRDSIFFTGKRLVAAIGLKDMVVVDTADATLITPKARVQDVKRLVGHLKDEGKEEYLSPSIEERPWGWFAILEQGPSYKIKHIFIKPKGRLSLQMHNHRSEHWIVISGTATVTRGNETFFVHQNESTFIPATEKHRLENSGKIPLRIIEIQSGEYLGEDDITRYDDIYGRNSQKQGS
jgi:mannose-1-phosphate guanylyltransferase/mannose-6-phosphate isomerase